MLFNSFDFLIFFPIVVLIYFIIPKKIRYIWLLVASYYFYMSWNVKYAALIAISTCITWLSGIFLERIKTCVGRKWVVFVSFASNLGILFLFKYFDFVLENLNMILAQFQMQAVINPFDVMLPVGISFYTFQALSYTIDVYRKEVEPEKNILRYALFVSFFPQLVAGPIERSKNLLKQVEHAENINVWNYDRIINGLIQMIWGLFLKMVIADRLSIFVDEVFNNAYFYGTIELFAAAVAFSIQIYCDFAGYSTTAIGAAKVMGFDLMENFNTPYFATNIRDFWHRWHISLSTWFRDYLYIPLGGNRCSKMCRYRNIMITFLASGLWHGASWTYVIWGGLHGMYQIIGDVLKPMKARWILKCKVQTDNFSYKFGQIIITFLLTTFAWIFFRAETIGGAFYYIKRMFTKWNPWVIFDQSMFELGLDRIEVNILFMALLVLFLTEIVRYVRKVDLGEFLLKQNLWFRWLVVFVLIISILLYGIYGINFDSNQFIYFKF